MAKRYGIWVQPKGEFADDAPGFLRQVSGNILSFETYEHAEIDMEEMLWDFVKDASLSVREIVVVSEEMRMAA